MSGYEEAFDRPSRRGKLFGYLKAANDVRQSYQQYYSEKYKTVLGEFNNLTSQIQGSDSTHCNVPVANHEKLVIFPSYAKRHLKITQNLDQNSHDPVNSSHIEILDSETVNEPAQNLPKRDSSFDRENSVDVDVRGWLYSPHSGPMTRKHRLLVGIAKQLCGIPNIKTSYLERNPTIDLQTTSLTGLFSSSGHNQEHNSSYGAEQLIEKATGNHGEISDKLHNNPVYLTEYVSNREDPSSSKGRSPQFTTDNYRTNHLFELKSKNLNHDLSQLQLDTANSTLMERLGPFMANLLEFRPITIFFYNDTISVRKTIRTNESGQFAIRETLNFYPTHFRVQVSENLSVTEKVKIIEPKGVSLISDIDDTIKKTSIDSGAREVFRNTFIRDFKDLTIEGVRDWYNIMNDMGVEFHYVSNSPWQLFPSLVRFFKDAGLPLGSHHLKSYNGMLQGIMEPVSERKKPKISKILSDFPDRYFLLVGDSSEADLEVYCDIVLANPGRIMMVLIRVLTHDFFDPAISENVSIRFANKCSIPKYSSKNTCELDPAKNLAEKHFMKLSDPKPMTQNDRDQTTENFAYQSQNMNFNDNNEKHHTLLTSNLESKAKSANSLPDKNEKRKPPPLPPKPLALRADISPARTKNASLKSSPEMKSSKPHPNGIQPSLFSVNQNIKNLQSCESGSSSARYNLCEPEKFIVPQNQAKDDSSVMTAITSRFSWTTDNENLDHESYQTDSIIISKKLEIWKRRWKKAEQLLSSQGVVLKSWRVGSDVYLDTVRIIEKKLLEIENFKK